MAIIQQAEGVAAIKAAWTWWSGELAPLVPEKVYAFFAAGTAVIAITLGESLTRIELKQGHESRLLGEIDLKNATGQALEALRHALWLDLPSAVRVEVVWSKDLIAREIVLPLAVENNLPTVLQYEIDRFTPFKKKDVYFGYRIGQRIVEHEKIKIELFAIQREKLTLVLDKLDRLRLKPCSVVPPVLMEGKNTGSLNLLPLEHRATTEPLWNHSARRLALVSAALLLAVLLYPAWQLGNIAAGISSDIAGIRVEATRVEAKQSSMATRLLAQDALISRRNISPGMLQLLYDITRTLPDNTWVSRLKIDDEGVSLQGESRKASPLIELLEQSEQFQNVGFKSSITRNSTTNMDQYEIHMDLVGGGT
jgi:general secretion pathway protein L